MSPFVRRTPIGLLTDQSPMKAIDEGVGKWVGARTEESYVEQHWRAWQERRKLGEFVVARYGTDGWWAETVETDLI